MPADHDTKGLRGIHEESTIKLMKNAFTLYSLKKKIACLAPWPSHMYKVGSHITNTADSEYSNSTTG